MRDESPSEIRKNVYAMLKNMEKEIAECAEANRIHMAKAKVLRRKFDEWYEENFGDEPLDGI